MTRIAMTCAPRYSRLMNDVEREAGLTEQARLALGAIRAMEDGMLADEVLNLCTSKDPDLREAVFLHAPAASWSIRACVYRASEMAKGRRLFLADWAAENGWVIEDIRAQLTEFVRATKETAARLLRDRVNWHNRQAEQCDRDAAHDALMKKRRAAWRKRRQMDAAWRVKAERVNEPARRRELERRTAGEADTPLTVWMEMQAEISG